MMPRSSVVTDPLKGWQTADEYLSGNVRSKLRIAQRAADRDPSFQINVEALQKAQPKDLDASEIEVRLGATWIDKQYIQQFMEETFNPPFYLRRNIQVNYSPYTAEWQITGKSIKNPCKMYGTGITKVIMGNIIIRRHNSCTLLLFCFNVIFRYDI